MSYVILEEARKLVPRIYSEDVSENVADTIKAPSKTHGFIKMMTDMTALSRGTTKSGYNPAAIDTARALDRQQGIHITYHIPLGDRLYNEKLDVFRFMQQAIMLGKLSVKHETDVQERIEALIMPGAHRDHTAYPGLRWSVEEYAFNQSSH